jgi:hypothetical protein
MCDDHVRCIPEDAPRRLGSYAEIYVRVDDYSLCSDTELWGDISLYEQNGYGAFIADRWIKFFWDGASMQDEPEYVYLLRGRDWYEDEGFENTLREIAVRERFLN